MNAITPVAGPLSPASLSGFDPARPVWTGRPSGRSAFLRVWKGGWVAGWFALLLADGARLALTASPPTRARAWAGEQSLLAVALVGLVGLAILALLTRRTTRYSIEARSVTLRYGMALSATLVIPFAAIEAVAARTHRDGTGDVTLRLRPSSRANYLKLWPHARPWRWFAPEPMLRCVPDAGFAAALLCRALGGADQPACGSETVNRLPAPSSDSSEIRPPMALTSAST